MIASSWHGVVLSLTLVKFSGLSHIMYRLALFFCSCSFKIIKKKSIWSFFLGVNVRNCRAEDDPDRRLWLSHKRMTDGPYHTCLFCQKLREAKTNKHKQTKCDGSAVSVV